MFHRWLLATIVVVVGALGCTSSGEQSAPDPDAGVRVASFDFAESELLAELYAQALENAGFEVVRVGAVGPREVVAPALEQDLIDLVPEYLGTAHTHFGLEVNESGSEAAFADLGLVLLTPAKAEDVNVVVVTTRLANQYGLTRISDLERVPDIRLGGPVECPDRPLCMLGLMSVYGLDFGEFVPMRSLDITAEALRHGEIEVGVMFSTAAQLSSDSLLALADDRNLQPAENVVPVVRANAIDRWGPKLVSTLNAVSAQLTTDGLRHMNVLVRDGRSVPQVVADWLDSIELGAT